MGIKKACLSKCANTYYTASIGREPQCDSLFLSNRKIISQNGSPCQKKVCPQNKLGKHKITGELKYVKH